MRLTIDHAGRVVIPKAIRQHLRLQPGDSLEVEMTSDQVSLRPVREKPRMKKENGIWVMHTGQSLDPGVADEVLRKLREERDESNFGPFLP
jgi:AbrB family looped-hinge helix DNA binding protein